MLKRLFFLGIIGYSAQSIMAMNNPHIGNKIRAQRSAKKENLKYERAARQDAKEEMILFYRKQALRKDNANAKKAANESFFLFRINQYEEKEIGLQDLSHYEEICNFIAN